MGVAGCGWPISASVVRTTTASFPLRKVAPTSASAADETTCLRNLAMSRMAPLLGWLMGEARSHKMVASNTAAGFGLIEVCGIAVNMEDHILCTVAEGGVRMGRTIVQEVHECLDGRLRAVFLCCCEGIERKEHSGVDGACVE
jgi:hypothetical protein